MVSKICREEVLVSRTAQTHITGRAGHELAPGAILWCCILQGVDCWLTNKSLDLDDLGYNITNVHQPRRLAAKSLQNSMNCLPNRDSLDVQLTDCIYPAGRVADSSSSYTDKAWHLRGHCG